MRMYSQPEDDFLPIMVTWGSICIGVVVGVAYAAIYFWT